MSRSLSDTAAVASSPEYGRTETDRASESRSPTDTERARPQLANDETKAISKTPAQEQAIGVTKVEALYIVFGKGWKLWALWGSIGLISFVYSLSQTTTYAYAQFATSAFGEHTIVGTIAVISGIISGVAQPFIAKCADVFSRPLALAVALFFYTIGYIIVAASPDVNTVVGGQVVYTLGSTGIFFLNGLLIADITSLQWRGAIQGAVSLPFVLNAFVAGNIASNINAYSTDGWRWGYGMFCILVPVCLAPTLIVLFWGDHQAKKVGALSLASSYARRQALAGLEQERRPLLHDLIHYWRQLDGFGLLIMGFAFGCLLSPFTLYRTAQGGYTNPSLIALLCVGGLLFIGWVVWETRFASHSIMPRRVMNRTFLACVSIDFLYFFGYYLSDTYFSSWIYIITDWSDKNYTYYNNIPTVGLCGFAVIAGLTQRYFHRYKYQQIFGLCIQVLGFGLQFLAVNGNSSNAVLVSSRVLVSIGGAISVISSQVAAQGSVPHQDMAIAIAVLALWTSIGGAIASAISASVWNRNVPANLEKYLGDRYDSTELAAIFGNIIVARATEPRVLVIRAYSESLRGLFLGSLFVSLLAVVAGLFAKNYYLGSAHNSIETDKEVVMRSAEEIRPDIIAAEAHAVQEQVKADVMAQRA